jgi:hypothetical protein
VARQWSLQLRSYSRLLVEVRSKAEGVIGDGMLCCGIEVDVVGVVV